MHRNKTAKLMVMKRNLPITPIVLMRATVAQSYAVFWKNIESNLVEVVSRNTVIDTTPMVSTTTTITPPIIMESKPSPPPRSVDSIYQGCSDTKLCFGSPEGCIQKADCQGIVTVFVAGDEYTFEVQATGSPKYVAAALSMDSKMGDDSAMECVQNNGRITLHASWTYPRTEPYVNRNDSPQNILTPLASSFVDGKLYCRFRRDTVSTVKGITFDLANKQYNLMIVAGSTMKDENRVGFHDKVYVATGSPMALSVVGTAAGPSKLLLKLHGCFMVAAWIGSASLGILLARYFRQTWVGKRFGGKDIWFAYHRIFMVATWLFTIIGFILILIEVGGYATTGDNPHAITGLVTVILCFIQPIVATIFLAVYLQKAELPNWTVYILAAFVAFHVIMHLILSLTVCVADGRITKGRVNVFPMKDMMGHTRQASAIDRDADAPYSSFRKLLLGVYAPIIVILAIVVICLVALAPIVQTYNNVSEVLNNAVANNGTNK
ncbi:Putative ferric-chelate reductase 1 homolog [Eumeta japonica]|uniref:Ferric-chelate reductase 1 homolog n=1 Tax=Eumeta variegata TaxID=151549 RepID=A0A4C1WZS6_EUMVA|nr:Putative ferric-chelate reductase 1 homolog [Eumeta japonica]